MCDALKEVADYIGNELEPISWPRPVRFKNLTSVLNDHRRLRKLNLESENERKRIRDEAWDRGYEEGKNYALTQEYMAIDKLKTMTIMDLVELLQNESGY
jgi:hypothetical protein